MRGFKLALAVALCVPFFTLSAQQPLPLEIGQPVRVTHCGPSPVYSGRIRTDCRTTEGNLVDITTDSVVLTPGAPPTHLTVPRDLMTRLEVIRGRKSNAGKGALFGFLTGVLAGVVVGASEGEGHMVSSEGAIAAWGLGLGAAGAVVGVITGAFIKTDRWGNVPLDQLRVNFAPQRDRGSFGVSLRF